MLPNIVGEFGVVQEPEIRFNDSGRPWAKIRGVAKDRRRGPSGEWEDGDPCYIDILIGGKQAENIVESVTVGDAIIVSGELTMREYEVDGKKQKGYSIRAKTCGVSVQFTPARPPSKDFTPSAAADDGGSPF